MINQYTYLVFLFLAFFLSSDPLYAAGSGQSYGDDITEPRRPVTRQEMRDSLDGGKNFRLLVGLIGVPEEITSGTEIIAWVRDFFGKIGAFPTLLANIEDIKARVTDGEITAELDHRLSDKVVALQGLITDTHGGDPLLETITTLKNSIGGEGATLEAKLNTLTQSIGGSGSTLAAKIDQATQSIGGTGTTLVAKLDGLRVPLGGPTGNTIRQNLDSARDLAGAAAEQSLLEALEATQGQF